MAPVSRSNRLARAPHSSRWCLPVACAVFAATALPACTQGEGEGAVQSERLYIKNCWNGPFDLGPNFFGANPFSSDVMSIRVQRGDDNAQVSDGLNVMVNDVQTIRKSKLNQDLPLGLPVGVSPPGIPLKVNDNPPSVSLTLYLQDTCHLQNGTVYSIGGTIRFAHLFSGDVSESNGDDRLTEASFDAIFADPHDMATDYTYSSDVTSRVTGWFKFYFQRGQPAQPFP